MRTSLRTIILATAVLTVAAPAAQAAPLGSDGHALKFPQLHSIAGQATSVSPPITITRSDAVVRERHAALGRLTPPPVQVVSAPQASGSGFDWTAAAMGAAAAGILFVLLGAGALGRARRLATGH
jgi:hypothetical protein